MTLVADRRSAARLDAVITTAAGAALLRIVWVVIAAREPVNLNDPAFYRFYGQSIARGGGYVGVFSKEPTAFYPPGYPYLVGAVTWLETHLPSPSLPVGMGLLQAALGTATVAMVAGLALRWWGVRAAWIAGGAMALWPNLIIHTAVLLSETTYLFAVTSSVWAAAHVGDAAEGRSARRLDRRWTLLSGVAFAASVLLRPQGALIGAALIVLWWPQRWRTLGLRLAAVGLCTLVAVAPWLVRNQVRLGDAVMSTNVGDNLCIGHAAGATGGFRLTDECNVEHQPTQGSREEVLHDEETTAIATAAIREDPLRQPRLMVLRLWHTVEADHDGLWAAESFGNDHWLTDAQGAVLRWLCDAWWGVAGIAAAVGTAVRSVRRRFDRWSLVCLAAVALALAAPLTTFGEPRFKIPAVPFVALLLAASFRLAEPGEDRP